MLRLSQRWLELDGALWSKSGGGLCHQLADPPKSGITSELKAEVNEAVAILAELALAAEALREKLEKQAGKMQKRITTIGSGHVI